MAGSTINNYYINVTDKGTLAKVSGNAKDLQKSLNGVTTSAEKANRAITTGGAAADSAGRSFSKLSKSLDGSIVQVYAGFAANVFALSVAFEQLRKAAQVQQVVAGLEYLGARSGIALNATSKALREVTNNALSTEQALRSTAQLAAAGFSTDTIEQVGQAAANASIALGRNLPDSIDRLTKGITKLEPELLDELGIMTKLTEATNIYALANNKSALSLSSVEKRIAFSNAVLAEAEAKFGGVAEAAGNTQSYEKLAASLEDLKLKSLTLAANGLQPIASILSGSGTTLTGSAILFANTLAKQVLPSLYDTATAAAKATEALGGLRAEELKDVSAVSGRTAAAKAYNESLKQDLTSYTNVRNSVVLVDAAIDDYNKKLNTSGKISSETRTRYLNQVQALQLQKKELEELSGVTARYNTQRASAEAIQNAGSLSPNTLKSLKTAYLEILEEQMSLGNVTTVTNKKGEQSFKSLQVTIAKTAVTARALGAATLAAIPYIGAAVLALGLLKQAWDFATFSKNAEAYKKSVESLKDAVDTLTKSSEQYAKVATGTASLQTRTASQYEIAANSIRQVVEASDDLIAKGKELEANPWPDWITGMKGIRKTSFISKEDIDGVNVLNSRVKQLVDSQKLLQDGKGFGVFDSAKGKELKLEFEAINTALNSSNPLVRDAAKASIEAEGGFDELAKKLGNAKVASATLGRVLSNLNKGGLVETGEAVKAAISELKNLETASTKFLRSSVDATPYDSVILSLRSVNSELNKTQAIANKTGNKAPIGEILSGLGPDTLSLLSGVNQELIQNYNIQSQIIQVLEARKKAEGSLSAVDSYNLSSAKIYVESKKEALNLVQADLVIQQKAFVEAQGLERLAKAQATLLSARVSRFAEFYALSGAGEKARMQAEDAIRGIQASQLLAQKAIIDSSIAQQRVEIERLKTLKSITDELTVQSGLEKQKLAYVSLTEAKRTKNKEAISAAQAQADYADKQLQAVTELEAKKNQILDLEASSKALALQAAAITAANTTATEKNAKARLTDLKISNEILNSLESAAQTQSDVFVTQSKLNDLQKGGEESFFTQLKTLESLNKAGDIRLSQAQRTYEIAKGQRDTEIAIASAYGRGSKAYADAVKFANGRVDAAKAVLDTTTATVEAEKDLNIEQTISFGYIQKYLPAKQQVLDFAIKELDAQKSILDARADIAVLDAKIAAAKQGRELSAEEERQLNISSLKDQIVFARTSQSLRLSVIAAEYALMKAQVYQQKENLKLQLATLTANKAPQDQIDNISEIIRNLEVIPATLDRAYQSQKDLVGLSIESMEKQRTLLETQAKVTNKAFNTFGGIAAKTAQLTKARSDSAANDNTQGLSGVAGTDQETTTVITAARKSLDTLRKQVKEYGPLIAGDLEDSFASLNALGPNGEVVSSVVQGMLTIAESLGQVTEGFKMAAKAGIEFDATGKMTAESAQGLTSIFQGIGSAVSAVSAIQQSMSKASQNAIDQEIAAEQARDGQSAASLAKISALEAKKDAMARKSFEVNKKLQIAQAVVNTASAVTGALASAPAPFNFVLAGLVAAMGAAQVALISSTSYQSAASSSASTSEPASIAIGTRGNSVDLAKGNTNAAGEQAYLRGNQGYGTDSSNFTPRAYGGSAYLVGEKGPEVVSSITPATISSNGGGSSITSAQPINVSMTISALDSAGVEDVLKRNAGTLIEAIRGAANDSGTTFLESVDTSMYRRKGQKA